MGMKRRSFLTSILGLLGIPFLRKRTAHPMEPEWEVVSGDWETFGELPSSAWDAYSSSEQRMAAEEAMRRLLCELEKQVMSPPLESPFGIGYWIYKK